MSLVPTDVTLSIGSTTSAAGRASNEDAVLATPIPAPSGTSGGAFLLAVADGMGGHEGGEVASQIAISMLSDLFARETPADVALSLKQAYRRANEAIHAQSSDMADNRRMGTTLVSAVVLGKYATIANVGDSRAYLIRSKQLIQITHDHSLVADQVMRGELTEDQARSSSQRNIVTHALGTEPQLDRKMPSIYELTLLPEDRLLLCSDGFFDVLQNEDYVSTILANNPQESAVALASLAIDRGTTDNVSAVVLEVSPSSATVQREQLNVELAANAPKMNPFVLPAILILVLVIAIAVGVFFFL